MPEDVLSRNLKALVAFRVLFVTVLLGTFFVFQIGLAIFPYPYYVLDLIVVLYSLSIVYLLLLGRVPSRPFAYIQLGLDVFAMIALIFITGGIESWFSWLLHLGVIAAALVVGKRAGYYMATVSSISYGILIDLQYYRILPIPIPYDVNLMEKDFLYRIFLNIAALYLMAYLIGELISRLERKERDIKDLTVFNLEVIENTPSGLFTTDRRGVIKMFNRAAEQITGISRDHAVGKAVHEIMPFLEALPQENRLENVVDFGHGKKVIGMNFSLMRDATGKKIGYIGIFQDLTELKRLSEEVKQKEKLATVGEFSARIAHEIRNPLASLKSSMEMLTESGLEGPMKERLVSIALKEMDRLNGILTELLDYTRPGGAEISRFDLNESLGEIAELLKNHGATGVVFRKDFSGPLLIEGDRGRLHQVFWNLGINAIEAMESSGGGELHIGTSMDNGNATIIFEDTGPGIKTEDMKKVFFPFFTTKRSGTGLGLSIASRIVEDHGGMMSVERPDSGGTRFVITLPVEQKEHV